MSKNTRKPTAAKRRTEAKRTELALKKAADQEFHYLEGRILDIRASLFCALQALEASDAVDACETASPARTVLFNGVRDLQQLSSNLDKWYVQLGQYAGCPFPKVIHERR